MKEMENNLNEAFENIVQSVIYGTIGDNGFLYRKEIVDSVEIQIRVEIRDRRMTACMGLLDDWRKDISREKEFIMPKETMHVDPIPDESIHTIDFAHGYDYCKNVMKKEIYNLFEDTMNGAAGEFIRGWNLSLTKLLEIMESEDKE